MNDRVSKGPREADDAHGDSGAVRRIVVPRAAGRLARGCHATGAVVPASATSVSQDGARGLLLSERRPVFSTRSTERTRLILSLLGVCCVGAVSAVPVAVAAWRHTRPVRSPRRPTCPLSYPLVSVSVSRAPSYRYRVPTPAHGAWARAMCGCRAAMPMSSASSVRMVREPWTGHRLR